MPIHVSELKKSRGHVYFISNPKLHARFVARDFFSKNEPTPICSCFKFDTPQKMGWHFMMFWKFKIQKKTPPRSATQPPTAPHLELWGGGLVQGRMQIPWWEAGTSMQLYTPAKWAPRSVIHGVILVIPPIIQEVLNQNQLMVKCWFGARWFGFLGSPKMKGIVTWVYP